MVHTNSVYITNSVNQILYGITHKRSLISNTSERHGTYYKQDKLLHKQKRVDFKMRKTMTKEVVFTMVTVGKLDFVNGKPVAIELPKEKLFGNISKEKAQKSMNKHNPNITVFEVELVTEVYEMTVDMFMKYATLKTDATGETTEVEPEETEENNG